MARPKSGDKPSDIKNATVAEVAAIGSTAVSVNKIADRAGVSVGTLYRYHATKDDLLLTVFLQIKQDIHRTMMKAAERHAGSRDRLHAMWFALVDYGLTAPQDFHLAELMSAEMRPELQNNIELRQFQAEILAEIQAGIEARVLMEASVQVIETVLASPALTLVRQAALSGMRPSDAEVGEVFDLIWRGIAR